MKSTQTKNEFPAVYRFLDHFSPIEGDCGKLCGCACCVCASEELAEASQTSDTASGPSVPEDDPDYSMGLYLMPGEEVMFTFDEDWIRWGYLQAEIYDFPESWHGPVPFFQCLTPPVCPREKRPLQCRTFPLAPHLDVDGNLYMIYNQDPLPYSCPLTSDRESYPLSPAFVKATFTAWKHLIRNPLIWDMVDLDSQIREEDGHPIEIVWPR